MKSLDTKLANLHDNPGGATDFILADAKDADMAFGLAAPGTDPVTRVRRSLADFRDQVREISHQGLVDIMLMSVSTSEQLTERERLFDNSPVTPAVRANDTSDIHLLAGARYPQQPSRPFRTATVSQIRRAAGVDLGLYSITATNDAETDIAALQAYREFRSECEPEGTPPLSRTVRPGSAARMPPRIPVGSSTTSSPAASPASPAPPGRCS